MVIEDARRLSFGSGDPSYLEMTIMSLYIHYRLRQTKALIEGRIRGTRGKR